MNIKPIASPAAIQPAQSNATDARARAIAKMQAPAQNAQQTPVADPNHVSAEEVSAIHSQVPANIDNNTEVSAEETPAETPQETPPEKDPALSRQFAQLARQERALRAKAQQQDQAYKAREQALAAREAELATKGQTPQGISLERIKQDALSVLAEAGVSYDDLTQQIISRQPVDPQLQAHINRLEAKLAEMEESGKTAQKTQQEQQQAQYQAAVAQIQKDAKALVMNNPEEYEAIHKTGTVKEIVNLIVKTHEKTGEILSVEEAAQEVENYLIEENLNMANSINKIKNRLKQNAQPAKPEVKQQATQPQTQPGMKTLTNAAASSRKLSAKERAILAFKGELKS